MTEGIAELLPEGWELEDPHGGLELVCPHGHTIEPDGACPEGCASPLRILGLI